MRWLGDMRGKRILDVAGGDGYWARKCRSRGATAVSIDISRRKLRFGHQLSGPPILVEADAQRLPFADASFDIVMSVCSIEHFTDGAGAIDEMARVLRPAGTLVLSADALTRATRWPGLAATHRARYDVKESYSHGRLATFLTERGLDVREHTYHFRSALAERFYLSLSRYGGRFAPNLAAVSIPVIAIADRFTPHDTGSVVLVRAERIR